MTDQVEQELRQKFDEIMEDLAVGHNFDYAGKELWKLIAQAHKGYEQNIGEVPFKLDDFDPSLDLSSGSSEIEPIITSVAAYYANHGEFGRTVEKAVAILKALFAERPTQADIDRAEHVGFNRGVYAFSNYFMDASIPAQRQQIIPDIARELVENYDPMAYKPLPLITPPHNTKPDSDCTCDEAPWLCAVHKSKPEEQ